MPRDVRVLLFGAGTALIGVWVWSKIDDVWRLGVIQSEATQWRAAFVDFYKHPATKVYSIGVVYIFVVTFLGWVVGTLLGRSVADIVMSLEDVLENIP